MSAAIAIVRVTVRNVLGLRRLIGFGLFAVLPAGVFLLIARTANEIAKSEGFSAMALGMFLPIIVPIITIVVAGSVLGAERRGSTLSFLMLRPLSRFTVGAAKLLSGVGAAFAITAGGALLLGLAGGIALGSMGHVAALLLATLIATVGYTAVYMPIGYLTERATLIGFIYIFVWELAVAGILEGLSGTSLWRIGASAFVGLAPDGLDAGIVDGSLGSLMPGAGGAALKMIVLALISVLVTGWLLRTRDLT